MRRRLRNVLTLVSAIVCVGSASLVGRSFVRWDYVQATIHQSVVRGATSLDGKLVLSYLPGVSLVPDDWQYSSVPRPAPFLQDDLPWQWTGSPRLGMAWGTFGPFKVVALPLWLVPIVTAIPPVRWWRRRRRAGGRGFAVTTAASGDDSAFR